MQICPWDLPIHNLTQNKGRHRLAYVLTPRSWTHPRPSPSSGLFQLISCVDIILGDAVNLQPAVSRLDSSSISCKNIRVACRGEGERVGGITGERHTQRAREPHQLEVELYYNSDHLAKFNCEVLRIYKQFRCHKSLIYVSKDTWTTTINIWTHQDSYSWLERIGDSKLERKAWSISWYQLRRCPPCNISERLRKK